MGKHDAFARQIIKAMGFSVRMSSGVNPGRTYRSFRGAAKSGRFGRGRVHYEYPGAIGLRVRKQILAAVAKQLLFTRPDVRDRGLHFKKRAPYRGRARWANRFRR